MASNSLTAKERDKLVQKLIQGKEKDVERKKTALDKAVAANKLKVLE